MNLCKNKQPVTTVANDTDILVMLIYHWEDGLAYVYMQRETSGKKGQETHSIRDICKALNPIIKRHILFAHAWSGCDTTSHCYGYGKNSVVRLLKKKTQKCVDLPKWLISVTMQRLLGWQDARYFHSCAVVNLMVI